MATTQPWFRYYTETPDDPKLKRVALMAECERIIVNGAWAAVMSMAKASPIEGQLLIAKDTPATIYEIADLAGTANIPLLEKILSGFEKLDMVKTIGGVLVLPHWNERQYKSDSSTPRVREYRKNKRGNVSGNENGNVSPPVTGNGPETDTEQSQNRAETEGGGNIFSLYQENIGMITPIISEQLKEAEAEFPFEWIKSAIEETITNNVRNWKYTRAILDRWKKEGYRGSKDKPPAKREKFKIYKDANGNRVNDQGKPLDEHGYLLEAT